MKGLFRIISAVCICLWAKGCTIDSGGISGGVASVPGDADVTSPCDKYGHSQTWSWVCSWEMEAGEIDIVGTWHETELGARFKKGATISKRYSADDANTCVQEINIEYTLDKKDGSNLRLLIDSGDDGHTEVQTTLQGDNWSRQKLKVTPEGNNWVSPIRLYLKQTGKGEVVLGPLQIEVVSPWSNAMCVPVTSDVDTATESSFLIDDTADISSETQGAYPIDLDAGPG